MRCYAVYIRTYKRRIIAAHRLRFDLQSYIYIYYTYIIYISLYRFWENLQRFVLVVGSPRLVSGIKPTRIAFCHSLLHNSNLKRNFSTTYYCTINVYIIHVCFCCWWEYIQLLLHSTCRHSTRCKSSSSSSSYEKLYIIVTPSWRVLKVQPTDGFTRELVCPKSRKVAY